MQENTNKTIAINSLVNYAKLAVNTLLALFTTRYALQALGVSDFGLFSVLGSIISFIGIFNTIMLSTCNRFLAVAIGKGSEEQINKQFNVNVVIFLGIAFFMLIIAYPIGDYYVHEHINYDGPSRNAMFVFSISIIGSIFSTLATPYNGLLMAKERFLVFSSVEVFVHIIRFAIAFVLLFYCENKLRVYTITMAVTTALPVFVYWFYCRKHFYVLTKWNIVREKQLYFQVFKFSGWVGYGAIACIARSQGAALLVNAFFNTAMNTALGIANSLNSYVLMFANSLTLPIQPQITKSYSIGNYKRTEELLIMSTKYSFMLMYIISIPFFVDSRFILSIWLGDVPDYAESFIILLIIDSLVQSFNSGLSTIIFASGKIAKYQLVINTMRLLSIIVAYFVLKEGAMSYSLFIVYIIFSILNLFCTQWCLKMSLDIDIRLLYYNSYLPSFLVIIFSSVLLLMPSAINSITRISFSLLYVAIVEYYIGLQKKERQKFFDFVKKTIRFSS